jgi:hypothetical protein
VNARAVVVGHFPVAIQNNFSGFCYIPTMATESISGEDIQVNNGKSRSKV